MLCYIHSLVPSYSCFYVENTICKTKNHKVMKSCHSVSAFKDTVAYLNTQGNTKRSYLESEYSLISISEIPFVHFSIIDTQELRRLARIIMYYKLHYIILLFLKVKITEVQLVSLRKNNWEVFCIGLKPRP